MAATALKRQKPVGSADWIAAEKENVMQLVDQEMEEVEFPVRHELDWLNEHMAEVFRGDHLNVTEIFKTPGKLRGKTPRTIRKHKTPAGQTRIPLSDIFSAQNAQNSPLPTSRFNQEISKLAVAKEPLQKPLPTQSQNSNLNYNADSGYHGMPDEDRMDVDVIPSSQATEPAPEPEKEAEQEQEPQPDSEPERETATQHVDDLTLLAEDHNDKSPSVARRTTEDSFHSAREIAPSKENTMDFEYSPSPQRHHLLHSIYPTIQPEKDATLPPPQPVVSETEKPTLSESQEHNTTLDHFDDIGSPSDKSTPERPLIRKSSLTFASLPAREPLKKSMGGSRMSRISQIDPSKNSHLGRLTGGARITQFHIEEKNRHFNNTESDPKAPAHEDSDSDARATKLHNKSSTQLLHEKINMLGKTQSMRGTKSIASIAPLTAQQIAYPEIPTSRPEPSGDAWKTVTRGDTPKADDQPKPLSSPFLVRTSHLAKDHNVDIIDKHKATLPSSSQDEFETLGPLRTGTPEQHLPVPRPLISHRKSASASSVIGSPPPATAESLSKHATVRDNPKSSTTPVNSPKRYEGPLSASKSKLHSIMKSAKGLFSSSASVSAAAKEAISPNATRSQLTGYPNIDSVFSKTMSQKPASGSPVKQEGRRTRSSTEKEERRKKEELKERQRLEEQLEKARDLEKTKASRLKTVQNLPPVTQKLDAVVPPPAPGSRSSPRKLQPAPKPTSREPEPRREEDNKFAVPTLPLNQLKKKDRRPVKPTRETQKSRPQPVSIKIGTLSQRIPLTLAPSAPSIQDSAPTPTLTKQLSVKKASIASSQTSASTSSFKSSTTASSAKSKATLAAEKRDQKQRREAQQRREADRKQVAQQEEARRQEQLGAEAERRERERLAADDPKSAAKKQAIEKRRLENARKAQQQKTQQPTPVNDMNVPSHQEKASFQSSQRTDMGAARPASRLHSVQPASRPQPIINPAKPPKRANEEEAVQTTSSKRRKTDEEVAVEPPTRPTMAPPIRQSSVRKEFKAQVVPPGYATATTMSQSQVGVSLFKHPSNSVRPLQTPGHSQAGIGRSAHPLEMSKFASGKIPFADSNPSHPAAHKTPGNTSAQKVIRASPAYPHGENIKLPEIPTDSEDEDSDAEPYHVPEWAKEENLRNILIEQEGKDGEMVFGPTAPLHMEEIFKDNKDRLRKFRDRTSSANWAGTDALTMEEIRWDMEQRERLKREGGWTFGV
ncbi:hypothetical protein PRK78_007509 [Emydomyces testavorans]|uniref:Inner centromere protein ARK-binding domain-containing protein n=1 Tax=Emydomyces testavorans TaxID=2070801 RepID=A0AAF0IQM7_9EURO|nr:hypothetical protein PRK78_007509 [Emydomyces testavorans]